MSTEKQAATVRDLVEEAKKRIVILVVCVVGLSYLLSLTSSSVLVNLPAAACLIILLRYFSLDVEMKRKSAAYNNSKPSLSLNKPPELLKAAPRSDWRSKVNSQVVEDAIDRFTRHLISEWVLDLWYSRITADKQGPEELVFIINGVLGELSRRFRNVNLIDLLTRDLIDIICRRVEIFREYQGKIERKRRRSLSFEDRDSELRRLMAADDKLHPALFSPESEHKVLQHIVDRLITLTFRPEDLHCAFFHYTVRELLACCVMRPVLNLANPRFINERIEAAVISRIKISDGSSAPRETSQSEDLSDVSHDPFSRYLDPSVTGVELVQLKNEQQKRKNATEKQHVPDLAKDPLLSMDTRSSRSWNSLPLPSKVVDDIKDLQEHRAGEGWGDVLDKMSQRKTETLSPEHLESVWAKGRNYRKKEGERVPPRWSSKESCNDADDARPKELSEGTANARGTSQHKVVNRESYLSDYSSAEEDEDQTKSSHSYTSEDEETVTGLNSPGTRVWDGQTNRNPVVSRIHHPLENSGRRFGKHSKGDEYYEQAPRHQSSRKRSRRSGHILGNDDSDDSENDSLARSCSGTSATSSASYISVAGSNLPNALKSSLLVDSFDKLRCEVLVANIVKSSSKMFAVYSVAVTDESNHSWSIKRRFRHFEELHRRLKVFPEYNLHLPPKHFLSTGVDIPVIQERCLLLDDYLKKLLQLPRVSGSIEVRDFLSVDSQTYAFSSSFSIIETLTVKHVRQTSTVSTNMANVTLGPLLSRENLSSENGKSGQHIKSNVMVDDLKSKMKAPGNDQTKTSDSDVRNSKENGGLKKGIQRADAVAFTGLPTEWVPPKLTLPLLDLVDVVFQLQEGGWIRRKAFWVAKQILQLGMGDALDDWVLEKIRILRRGTVVASGIQRVEQILWPDGIFITKHPKRQQQSSSFDEEQQQEAERRAKFVRELMIEKAPATIVSLVGQKEYEQCAEDLYFFLQSSVCLKLLAYDLVELLLTSAFPEMEQSFKQLQEEKHLFGQYTPPT
ncbi:unnamed protein product [Brassica oleracea var. botrytis]|uniref:(rape) hypothetical protein n=1 Tax=Brassica napus TaxID=3708 RepID=A0A078HMA7_BRANA|nr:unnamed protein product [Brassica napus]CDY39625.1 BnaC05g11540D [Brassica napus]